MRIPRLLQSPVSTVWLLLAVSVFMVTVSGCARIRLLTYPNEFVWVDQQTVKGTMHAMYQSLKRLDALLEYEELTAQSSQTFSKKNEIVNELRNLEAIASSTVTGMSSDRDTKEPYAKTNHLLLDEHMDDFVNEVSTAISHAEAEPPHYFKAGQLVGECNACHRER